MKICSLLPSATEIVAALGHSDSLVGVSDECRWPPEVRGKRVVTVARIDPSKLTSHKIDEAVRASVLDGRSLYALDAELVEELRPNLVITQDLCAVCAVSGGEVASVLPPDVDVLSLDPRTLAEVVETFRVLARRLGTPELGRSWQTNSRRRSRGSPTRCAGCRSGACSSRNGSTRRSAPATGSRR